MPNDEINSVLPGAFVSRVTSQEAVEKGIITLLNKLAVAIRSASEKGEFSLYFSIPGYGKIRTGMLAAIKEAGYTTKESDNSPGSFLISWDEEPVNLH